MKKTIEEKARAYDKALDRAKYYYNEGKTLEYADDIASDIFPELREDGDEIIKEELINYLKHRCNSTTLSGEERACNKWITWLERQDEQEPIETTWKPSDEQMNAFEQAYNWYNTHSAQSLGLNSLYYDLKKLKA